MAAGVVSRVTTRNAVTRATVQGRPPSLADELAPLWSAINRLQARQMSIFPATVTSTNPVRIRIDGETRSLAATPDNGLPVGQGERVRVIRYGTTHLIVARMNARRQAFAQAAGTVSVPASDGSTSSVRIDYPDNRFTTPPVLNLTTSNSLHFAVVVLPGVTGATAISRRVSSGNILAHTVYWHAVQMAPDSAEG